MELFQLGNLKFHNVNMDEAVNKIVTQASSGSSAHVVTPNAYHCFLAEKDNTLINACNQSMLCLADGMPIIWAAKICKQPLKAKVSGSDLVPHLCKQAAKEKLPVFIMGGMPNEAEQAAKKLEEKYPGLEVAGIDCPPFGFEFDNNYNNTIKEKIVISGAKILFVGVGTPKQEKWIAANPIPGVVSIGVGMSIAFCAGSQKRAPLWMQKSGFEWFYRLVQEPRRLIPRYFNTFKVFYIIMKTYLKGTK